MRLSSGNKSHKSVISSIGKHTVNDLSPQEIGLQGKSHIESDKDHSVNNDSHSQLMREFKSDPEEEGESGENEPSVASKSQSERETSLP